MGGSTSGGGSGGSGRQPGADTAIGIAQDPRGEYTFGGGYSAALQDAPSTGTYFSGADEETQQRAQDLLRDIDAGGGEVTFGGQKVERMQKYESDSGDDRYMVQAGGRKRDVSADTFRALQGAFRDVAERQKRAEEAQKELKALEKAEGERVQRETAAAAEAERQAAAEAQRQAAAEAERQKQADADKRRAEEQARAQREAEERQQQQRERERAEEARLAAEERNEQFGVTPRQVSTTPPPADAPDADKQRAAEIERAQREAEERAQRERLKIAAERNAAKDADLMPKGDPYTDPQKASGVRTDATSLRNYRDRMNEAVRQDGETNIVQSNAGEVTDTQGNPVLTRQGVERQTQFQQEELERLVSMRQGGKGDIEQGKRDLAEQIIKEKLAADPTLPAGLKAIREINLRNQLKNLEAGGTPTFRIGEGGEFVTSGVLQPGEEGTGIAPNITSDLETMMDEREQEEEPTILQVEPEPEPDDVTAGALGVAPTPRGRRGTRTKRPGAGGTLLEGGGVLYD